MLNIKLGHSVRPQPYKKINNTCANSTTLSTSFNEPLQWFTSKSKAALKTCQAPLQETQHTDNNKGKSGRECTENTSPQIISTNMAAVVQGKVKNYSASTPTLPTGCFHSMNPSHFNLVHLYYLSHACTLVTQLTTDNVPHRTPEGTPIGLVRTRSLVTSSGIQLVLVDVMPYHISMSSLSCTVHHVGSILVNFVEQ